MLADVEDQLALAVGDLRAHHGGLVLRGLKTVLAFFPALEQVTYARVELSLLVEVVGAELVGLEDGKELGVETQRRIGTQVGRGFFSEALLDGRAQRLQRMVMLQCHTNGVVQGDPSRASLSRVGLRRRTRRGGRCTLLTRYERRRDQQCCNQNHSFPQVIAPRASLSEGRTTVFLCNKRQKAVR